MATEKPREDEGLWVRSDVLPDGTYGVTVTVEGDRAWTLGRDQAIAYAVCCFRRATEAEHDAAAFGLLTNGVGMPEKTAAAFIVQDLRPSRPDDHTATEPLHFTTALGLKAGPFIHMMLDGRDAGEMTTADLRQHAAGVLDALAAADLDANLRTVLVGQIGLDEARAMAVVGGLTEHWPASRPPRNEADDDA